MTHLWNILWAIWSVFGFVLSLVAVSMFVIMYLWVREIHTKICGEPDTKKTPGLDRHDRGQPMKRG